MFAAHPVNASACDRRCIPPKAQVGVRAAVPWGMMQGMKRDEYQIVTKPEVEVPGCVSLAGFTVVPVGLGLWGLFGMLTAQLNFSSNTPA